MAETANIAAIAEKFSGELFGEFFWKRTGPMNENWACEKSEHHKVAEPCRRYYKKNARSTAGNFPKIDQGTVEKTLISVPSAAEQAELENSFRTMDDKLRSTLRVVPPYKTSSAPSFTN